MQMEAAARQLQAKFDAARRVFDAAGRVFEAPGAGAGGGVGPLERELDAQELRYFLAAAPLGVAAAGGEADRVAAQTGFARLLAAEDFSGGIDRLVERAEAALAAAGCDTGGAPPRPRRGRPRPPAAACAEVRRALELFPRAAARRARGEAFPAEGEIQRVEYFTCPACGLPMGVDAGRSVLHCEDCGALRRLDGTVFDDSQFYSQEGQKAKSGAFNPNRHFVQWWTHIFALEPLEELGDRDDPDNTCGEKTLAALRALVARDGLLLRRLTIDDVRRMLKELHKTELNKNSALILKELTGVGPPVLDEAVAVRAENLFKKALEAGEALRTKGGNRKYYPFYIFKILDQILVDPESRRVLYYIYIQGRETVEADDCEWERICRALPGELRYVPTDRSLGQSFCPL